MSDRPSALPVQLRLDGRRCLVVGAGTVGARRARTLVEAGATVDVVAPVVDPAVEQLAERGVVRLHRRSFEADDVLGAVLVVAATGTLRVDEAVGDAARAAGVLCNRADDATRGDLAFPAVVRRDPVAVAVSTSGRAPAVARWLADLVEAHLDELTGLDADGVALLVDIVDEVRVELRAARGDATGEATGVTMGAVNWRRALDRSILDLIDQGRRAEAKERLLACLSSS